MHIKLYLDDAVPIEEQALPEFGGYSVFRSDRTDRYIELDMLQPTLPLALQRREPEGVFRKVVVITGGRGNAPVEGEYNYPATAEGEDDVFATVEYYSDGSWHLRQETSSYAAAHRTYKGIRTGRLAPTTYWGLQPQELTESTESAKPEEHTLSDREGVFCIMLAFGFGLLAGRWMPDILSAVLVIWALSVYISFYMYRPY